MNPDDDNPANPSARVLAPVALVIVAVAVAAVVASGVGDSNSEDAGKRRDRQPRTTACKPSEDGRAARENGYYVIQPGEPGLSAVADETCISVEELERLNPDLDSQLIPQGGCVDLRPDGCKALAEG